MQLQKVIIIRSTDKRGTSTANSEYLFHFSAYPVNCNISLYEGSFKNIGQNRNLHYHKVMTEIFTVTQGEFYFNTVMEEYVLQRNDTIIIPPMIAHGFRAKISESSVQFVFTGITGREEFFAGLAKIANHEMSLNEQELEAFYNKYDQYMLK
jgi:mannose-6-phosphate isomerase-like protein (cupin superfamily)